MTPCPAKTVGGSTCELEYGNGREETQHVMIFRYELELIVCDAGEFGHPFIAFRQSVEMPEDADIVSIAPGRSDCYHIDLWATVPNPDAPKVKRHFNIVGTGHLVPVAAQRFIGTAVMPDGFVWHVFEEERRNT